MNGVLFYLFKNKILQLNCLYWKESYFCGKNKQQQLTLNNHEKSIKNGGIDAVCRSYDDSMQL